MKKLFTKKGPKTCLVTCDNSPYKHKKTYESVESKKKPGYAICPACGEYHEVRYE